MRISKKLAYKLLTFFVAVPFLILNIMVVQEVPAARMGINDIRNGTVMPPSNVLNAIRNICRNCELVTLNDLVEEAREEFLGLHPNANPGWITGDFNGDGLIDYAVLLYSKGKGKIYTRLIVLLATRDKTFTVKALVKSYEGGSYWYIALMKAGSIIKHTKAFAPPKNVPKEVLLKYPAIKYYKTGSFMNVFYFEASKGVFIEIPVSY